MFDFIITKLRSDEAKEIPSSDGFSPITGNSNNIVLSFVLLMDLHGHYCCHGLFFRALVDREARIGKKRDNYYTFSVINYLSI